MTSRTLALIIVAISLVSTSCDAPKKNSNTHKTTDAKLDNATVSAFLKDLPDDQREALLKPYMPAPPAPAPPAPPPPTNPSPDLPERTGVIHRKGAPLTLLGPDLKVGDTAPRATLADHQLQPFTLEQFKGRPVVVSVVPSLDTPVCETQTGQFAAMADTLPNSPALITISRDLPFAQRRFNDMHGLNVTLVSDFRDGSFAKSWGLLVKESGLLARSVWIVDPEGTIAYRQIVADQATEPNYDAVKQALEQL